MENDIDLQFWCYEPVKDKDGFRRLEIEVNKAIKEAKLCAVIFQDLAINWKDLKCDRIEYVYDGRREFNRIIISEAAPVNNEFHEFIKQCLKNKKYHNFEVVTEW